MEIGLPEKTSGDRAPRTPRLAETAHLDLVRSRTEAHMIADRDLQTEITGWPDVWSSEREEQIDFGAPPSDSLDGQQLGKSRLVVGSAKPAEIEFAIADHFGEVTGIPHLLSAEAARTKGRIV
jgi:hypothetical protein